MESPAVLLPFALCILPDFPRPQGGDSRLSPSTNSKGHEGSAGKGQIPSKRSTNAVISTNSFGKSAPVRPTRSAVKHSHQGSHRRCSSHGMRSARAARGMWKDSCEVCEVDMTNLVVSPTKATIASDLIAESCCLAPKVCKKFILLGHEQEERHSVAVGEPTESINFTTPTVAIWQPSESTSHFVCSASWLKPAPLHACNRQKPK